jgi:probable rRNA maturation factor
VSPSAEPVIVDVHDETATGVGDLQRWREVANATLVDEGVATGRLDLLFVDREQMATLNQTYLGAHGPTDVLAFPLDGPDRADQTRTMTASEPAAGAPQAPPAPSALDAPGAPGGGAGPPCHLGDVVVCPSVATDQAADHAGDLESELTLLIVHGVLHVLGHDHAEPDETRAMQERERHHLRRHGVRHPVEA